MLIETPFSPLQQSYQQCHASPSVAATTNLGVTVGNIVLLAPFFAIAIVISLSFFRFLFGIRLKRTAHSKKEQTQALEEFAESLLNTRDNYFSLLDLCNRYEIAVVGSMEQRISAMGSSKVDLAYAIQDVDDPGKRAKLKKRFVGQFIDVSRSVVTFALVKELELAGGENGEAEIKNIDLSVEQNSNTKGKSSMWQFSPSMMASQNPMIIDSLATGIELNGRNDSSLNPTNNSLEADHLVLVMNKRNSNYGKGEEHHKLTAPHNRIVLTANVQNYDQWFSSLSAINVKLTMLLERRLKTESIGGGLAKVENIDNQHMLLVNELEHFTTISWLSFKPILFQTDDEDKLLFNLLLQVLEIHGCLMLHTSDRSSIKTKYQHKVAISFSDVVWTYSDLIRLSEEAGLP